MNILFVAPLPPPIHGQAYVSDVLLTELKRKHKVKVVNFSKKRNGGKYYFIKRYLEVLDILFKIFTLRGNNHAIYITISQSLLGNVKDLITYLLLYKKLSVITIHLHGGAIRKELWDKYPLLLSMNKFFISKMNAVIISGISHQNIFEDIIENSKIRIVTNFAPDEIFIKEHDISVKFKTQSPLKVIYISGMRNRKGYYDLLKAYKELPAVSQRQVQIDFAGEFESREEQNHFIQEISAYENLNYRGVVSNFEKKKLFHHAHIFCLPTKYLEGQPVSILEAYASGCCVLTTALGGIEDIFTDKTNGFKTIPEDSESIAEKIDFCLKTPEIVEKIARLNFNQAEKMYQKSVFLESMENVILNYELNTE